VFSIVLPSMPAYLVSVGAPPFLNGWAVAANSCGSFLAGPIFGFVAVCPPRQLSRCQIILSRWWADKRGVKEVTMITLGLLALANVWYGLARDEYQIIAARFLVGVASANAVPSNAFLSYATGNFFHSSLCC